jgi:hypothetical protein
MALKNNFDVIAELEAPLRAIEDLTGFRLWHDLQQRVWPFIDPAHVREGVDLDVAKRARYPLRCFPPKRFT